ncbi:unnamed protein product [Phytomonas sp. EM1]|nr:unnamed protein product [Phytomonas sp. EM1]|eukprot:CCW61295.1 unnamed protein product [Phytomonas sp. isolate EM1]
MICTFIRPSILRYDELYDMEKCAQFISGYMRYEPLYQSENYTDNQNDIVENIPTQVVSPKTALMWQTGNCLEMSIVLVSLLCGSGYNAFVVVGYADPVLCLNDHSMNAFDENFPEINIDDDDSDAPLEEDSDYIDLVKQRPVLRNIDDPDPDVPSDEDEPLENRSGHPEANKSVSTPSIRPLHCWVMVLRGGRKDLKNPTFIETATGKLIPLLEADQYYLGIESVFNNKNYYVNMKPESPISSLSIDLRDLSEWESLIPTQNESDANDLAGSALSSTLVRRAFQDLAQDTMNLTQSVEAFSRCNISIPSSWVKELTITPQQYISRYPGNCKEFKYSNATVRLFAEYSQPDLCVKEVLLMDSEPHGHEKMHLFYQHRADKLQRRTLINQGNLDADIQHINESCHVLGLPSNFVLEELYERGRMRCSFIDGLHVLIYKPGHERTMKFYSKVREDGLYKRIEFFYDNHSIKKIKEYYKGRTDRLYYRSASFAKPEDLPEIYAHENAVNIGYGSNLNQFPRPGPIRLSQKFLRNESIPFHKDVAKATFTRPALSKDNPGEMKIFFHYSEGSIIRPFHVFTKVSSSVEDYIAASTSKKPPDLPVKITTVPGQDPPNDLELYTERKFLSTMESECLAEVRAKLDEHIHLLNTLEKDHRNVERILSTYDTLRNRTNETEAELALKLAERVRKEESQKDYLAPYIAKLKLLSNFDGNYLSVKLTAEQARLVRDAALSEQKERLIQRGQIMQMRIDKEKDEFNKRQQLYKKRMGASAIEGGKEAEEFAAYCKEATRRIKVVDERLAKHVDQASEKYERLAQRLSEDPRLSALYSRSFEEL